MAQLFDFLLDITGLSKVTLYILMGLLLLFILQILYSMIQIVPQSENWTVQRFGRYVKTLNPGINIIFPFVDGIGSKINMREQVLDVPPQYIITADNATITVDGVIFFKVFDAYKATYEVENFRYATEKLGITSIRTVMGAMVLDELLSNREVINTKLLEVLDAPTDPWGVKITRIEIKDITPPTDIQDSMNNQMKEERNRRVEITKAEADREAAILRAEGESKALVLRAEARKREMLLKAEVRERNAQAEAKSIDLVAKSIKKGGTEAPKYFLGSQYVKSLKKMGSAPNNKIIFMPFETAKFMGSVGSLAHLTKAMMKTDESPTQEVQNNDTQAKTDTEINTTSLHSNQDT